MSSDWTLSSSSGGGLSNIFGSEDADEVATFGETEAELQRTARKEALMLALDARLVKAPQISTDPDDPDAKRINPLTAAIDVIVNVFMDKIIQNDTDLLGVVLYNTEKTQNPNDAEGVYLQTKLEEPGAPAVASLESLRDDPATLASIGVAAEGKPDALSSALWVASAVFSRISKTSLSSSRVWVFAPGTDPAGGVDSARAALVQRVRDLTESGTGLELFTLAANPVDVSPRWRELAAADASEVVRQNTFESLRELKEDYKRKVARRRVLLRMTMTIGDSITMAINLYNMYMPSTKSTSVWLEGTSNKPVKVVQDYICGSTGATLDLKTDVDRAYQLGATPVVFTTQELLELKHARAKPTLHILGFKPASRHKIHHNVGHSYFVFPGATGAAGAPTAFAALVMKMDEKKQMAIALFAPRRNAEPGLVALHPQREEIDDNGDQLVPPGLVLCPLPFADDVRSLDIERDRPVATQDQIDAAKEMVKGARIRFDPLDFPNPALQRHWNGLTAVALGKTLEEVEKTDVDIVKPNNEAIMKKLGPVIQTFKEATLGVGYVSSLGVKRAPAKKRALPGADAGGGKKARVDDGGGVDWAGMAATGSLSSMTVTELKLGLKAAGLAVAGKKADLVARLQDHFNKAN